MLNWVGSISVTALLICYVRITARQKEKALGSIVEVVQTVKHPRKNHEEPDNMNLDYVLPKSAAMSTPSSQTPQADVKGDASRGRFSQDAGKYPKKSERSPSLGLVLYLYEPKLVAFHKG